MSEQNADIKKRRLGRGLSGLLSSPVAVEIATQDVPAAAPATSDKDIRSDEVTQLPLENVAPNPSQPRRRFDDGSLAELAESIKSAGVMQPVIVRRSPQRHGAYELVAGERRWRAARIAGLTRIPAIVKDLSDSESAQWALIENLQREDLGPMEKAAALKSLVERFGLTHSEVALRVGLERASVTNMIRLLELEPEIASALENGELSMGHGRALLSVPAGPARTDLAARAVLNQWSVRRLEREAAEVASQPANGRGVREGRPGVGGDSLLEHQAGVHDLERQLSEHLGTKVKLLLRRGGTRGRLVVEFYDLDHFDGLMARIGFKSK